MGRQFLYFATKKDMGDLIQVIQKHGGLFITDEGKEVDDDYLFHIINTTYESYRYQFPKIYIRLENSHIRFDSLEEMNLRWIRTSESEVIEMGFPYMYQKKEKAYVCGRLWYENSYWNKERQIVKKPPELDKLYDVVKRYIRKNYRISQYKYAYIAPDCYELYKKGEYISVSETGISVNFD